MKVISPVEVRMSDFEILDGVGGAALKVRLPIASRDLVHEVVLSARAPSE